MVNWTYIWTNYDATQPEVKDDLGFARYPQSTQGEASRPPYGGIGVGVSEYSRHKDEAMQAIECITSPENQGVNAELTGNMPASSAGYQLPGAGQDLPASRCSTCSSRASTRRLRARSRRTGATSPAPSRAPGTRPDGVDDQTPPDSQQFIEDVLHGRSLL